MEISRHAPPSASASASAQQSQRQPASSGNSEPRRFIYGQADMEAFRTSPAKKELLGFATALGRSCCAPPPAPPQQSRRYKYDPSNPLTGLSPAMASLHGSLRQMSERWLEEVPPDTKARARFGNPSFRVWHDRLVSRSESIVRSALDCHRVHVVEGGKKRRKVEGAATGRADSSGGGGSEGCVEADDGGAGGGTITMEVLQCCSDAGYAAASGAPPPRPPPSSSSSTSSTSHPSVKAKAEAEAEEKESRIVSELRAYLHQSFGHPVRLDYGTGHESSFLTFLYCLCKLRCIGDGGGTDPAPPPEPRHMAPVALSIFSAYLTVTRGLQKDYMLEPAGSHGVWGLDDYHCLPFYFGACQLQDDAGDDGGGEEDVITPRSIHDDSVLRRRGDDLMYLGCIRYVKELKPSVPFFESSPMLDDISNLPSWGRVGRGLLRLYEGEVLDKMPVVQHFVFGTLFKATWTPSAQPREAPSRTFINGPQGDECIAPWAQQQPPADAAGAGGGGGLPPPTRAPWAK